MNQKMTSINRITRGLQLPITGEPQQVVADSPVVRQVALVADDYVGMKPTMAVGQGDRVKLGQVVFTDKKTPGVDYVAPGAGTVVGIHRGAKRKFESLVIELEGDGQETFDSFPDERLSQLDPRQVRQLLIASGLWTALRTRPFSKVPPIDSVPQALFVTAIDTNPLAADPAVVLELWQAEFIAGLEVLSTLTDGQLHVCRRAGAEIPGEGNTPAEFHSFDGPHPAGLVGTHVHLIAPVSLERTVWHIGYQDVAAIGHLFLTGQLMTDRIVSLAGPIVGHPRLIRTRLGASLGDLTADQFLLPPGGSARVISGSVLSGRQATPPVDFLGRYHTQVSLLAEGTQREFLGWIRPGPDKFSVRRVFASAWRGGEKPRFPMNTSTGGSPRAIIPIGMYEQVMPLDIVATPLLKALITKDTQYAQQLGVLELDEEDLALCTFVCPGKYDYGPLLRRSLTRIELDG